MGSAIDLLTKTQKAFVSNTKLAVGEAIVYTHKESTAVESINAFINDSVFNEAKKRTRGNFKTFSNVFLTEEPEVDDTILYDGLTYKVLPEWSKRTGFYIIHAENDKRHNGRKLRSK